MSKSTQAEDRLLFGCRTARSIVPIVLFVSLGVTIASSAYGQAGIPLWTNQFIGLGTNGMDEGAMLALDSKGNAVVTGYSWSGREVVCVTIKYSSAGALLWTNFYVDLYEAIPVGIAVSVNDNVFVAGTSIQNANLYTPFIYDYFTLAYSSDGAGLWTNRYNGPAKSGGHAYGIAVDAWENVFVTGVSGGFGYYPECSTIKYTTAGLPVRTNWYSGREVGNGLFGATGLSITVDAEGNSLVAATAVNASFASDAVTIKYSSNGSALWTNRYGYGRVRTNPRKVATDSNNDVLVTGQCSGSNGILANFTIKYSSKGALLWTNAYNASGPGNGAMAVDAAGNVFVAVCRTMLKYSSAGLLLWTNSFEGDSVGAIALDRRGNVFATGAAAGGGGYVTMAYSNAGLPLWTNRYHGPGYGSDSPTDIAVDAAGCVFVTGISPMGADPFTNRRFTTIKYGASSAEVPISLKFQTISNQLVLSWSNPAFLLQGAAVALGPFTNLSGASSPYSITLSGGQRVFRLKTN